MVATAVPHFLDRLSIIADLYCNGDNMLISSPPYLVFHSEILIKLIRLLGTLTQEITGDADR